MSAPMVRALLDGRKTQTRRIVKPRKDRSFGCELAPHEIAGEVNSGNFENCPYGQPGDRLWVREAWNVGADKHNFYIEYRADNHIIPRRLDRAKLSPMDDAVLEKWQDKLAVWNPSIFMPRWASRITLEVVSVRVERLQEISYEDACAEGCELANIRFEPDSNGETWEQTARRLRWPQRSFCQLWNSIKGAGSWDANPWVWCVEFKRLEP